MATPRTAITRFDLSMSYNEFSLRANRRGFVALRVLTPILVGLQNAQFLRVLIESLLGPVEDTKRAPKGEYPRDDFEWTTDSFTTDDHGVEEVVDDRTIKIYNGLLPAEMIHTERAINRVLQALENEAAGKVFNTSTWTGAPLTTAVATPWTTAASAKPIDDIDAAMDKVLSNCGQKPNALVVTNYALKKIARTAQVQDLLKYSGQDDPKNLRLKDGLAKLLDLEEIIDAEGFKNSSDAGQDAAFTRFWDPTMAMVCHVNKSQDLEDPVPTIGRTLMWAEEVSGLPGDDGEGALIVEEYREERRRGGVIRARADYQTKIMHAEAGHLLTAVTA